MTLANIAFDQQSDNDSEQHQRKDRSPRAMFSIFPRNTVSSRRKTQHLQPLSSQNSGHLLPPRGLLKNSIIVPNAAHQLIIPRLGCAGEFGHASLFYRTSCQVQDQKQVEGGPIPPGYVAKEDRKAWAGRLCSCIRRTQGGQAGRGQARRRGLRSPAIEPPRWKKS